MLEGQEKMNKFLTRNNREKLNEYINGYYSAIKYSNDIGVDRSKFYLAIEKIDPDAVMKRKLKRLDRLSYVAEGIMFNVPYEMMEVDFKGIFGAKKYDKTIELKDLKKDLYLMLIQQEYDLQNYKFIAMKNFTFWYKKYLISIELENSKISAIKLHEKYNLSANKIYLLKKFMKEEGRVLKDATIEQEEKFKKYAVMYEEYKKDDISKEVLAKNYSIPLKYIEPLLNGFIKAEVDIKEEAKELAKKNAESKKK
ncbi:hypothetical protein [Staphylococcus shinii]|uniref:hypothetical protein n=1 Tax=Staphylococcus shinii TaxID=2912228 RepID=UPI003F5781C2